ncbi:MULTISPECIES: PQQ-dependent sugar dehydrogenase [Acinetobacter]|uniref:PQQ-dependent sugar dehydrogenase n=1 Tax=Acinetobacter TaxID=469 RepID=UPI000661FDC5|nr:MULTISPECIES: PQQ-dependent sugar dehydrogenase [Acinetobacter]KMU99057.1 glucose dehydrogenase [Acinetobacter sp. VT 511]MBB4836052.1 glucose/arabinose dehydrogenase [Acinetobacter schindleri]OIJ35144.1 glucose dehydrogenase [Acinetobacter sp. LCT-H3]WBX38086.1 PQQ-dependent sugar dehydrogenase [Acinetobacter schindleri]
MKQVHLAAMLCLGFIPYSLTACHAQNKTSQELNKSPEAANSTSETVTTPSSTQVQQAYKVNNIAEFNEPWAITPLKDGRLLVTERKGRLYLFDPETKKKTEIKGTPKVAYGGQGGLGDVALHPDFANNPWIYLSYAEQSQGGYGAVVIRGKLDLKQSAPQLTQIEKIWTQIPKFSSGQGHYGHRIVFGPDGKLWISSGERQQFDPAQDMKSNAGKIIRLNDDGSIPADNPFMNQGKIAQQVWSLGHRNPLGMAFDPKGQLWVIEMGPKGGDELNKIIKAKNYGYPLVSNGDHYNGKPIPDHSTRPEFEAPVLDWTPVISPSDLNFYTGKMFPQWQNKAIATGLSSKAIIIIDTMQQPAKEVQRLDMKARIRGAVQAQDGGIWVIEDGPQARLLKLTAL